MSQIPGRNGWTIAAQAGDRAPDKTQRLLNRAVWDAFAAMGVVRRLVPRGGTASAHGGSRPLTGVRVERYITQVMND